MLKSLDRIKELTSTTGTGTLTLTGAESGFQAFSVLGNGTKCYYTITDVNTTDFEVGEGTYNSNTLTRDTIFESSNSGNAISLSATGSTVFVTYPAEKSSYRDIGVNRDYTASGSITAGKPLILNADNTVTQIAETGNTVTEGFATENRYNGTNAVNWYAPNLATIGTNKVATCYSDGGNSNYAVGQVAEVSANGDLSFGTKVVLNSATSQRNVVGYNSSNSTIAFGYTNASNNAWYSKAGTISGTTLSLGSEGTIETSISISQWSAMVDADTGHFVIFHTGGGKVYATAVTINGTNTPSKAYGANITGAGASNWYDNVGNLGMGMDYDTNLNRYLLTSGYATGTPYFWIVANSGSAFTITEKTIAVTNWKGTSNVVFDPDNNKMILSYKNTSNQFSMAQLTMASADFTIDHYIHTSIACAGAQYTSYETDSNKIVALISGGGSASSYATFTNNSTAFTQVSTGTWNTLTYFAQKMGIVKKSLTSLTDNPIPIIGYANLNDSDYTGYAISFLVGQTASTNLTSDNYFGIASSTASTTEPVGVNRAGSFNNDQTGMTAGKDMYVTDAGLIKERTTTTTTPDTTPTVSTITKQNGSTYSVGSNSIAYESTSGYYVRGRRDLSVNYPVVESGTWGSLTTGITWNTPTVLSSNSLRGNEVRVATGGGYAHLAYCTRENSNENAKVTPVAISGSGSLSLGTTTTVSTTASSSSDAKPYSVVYNTSENTVLAFFYLGWQSGYLNKVFPLQMSGANYSYSSSDAVTITSSNIGGVNQLVAGYDSDTNRTVAFYSENETAVKAKVISCSGVTITVGSAQNPSFSTSARSNGYSRLTYDTQNNKFIFMYDSSSPVNYAPKYSIVTVTGGATNTLSFTSDAYVFSNTSQQAQEVVLNWNSDANELFMVYPKYSNSHIQCNTFSSNGSTLTTLTEAEYSTEEMKDTGSEQTAGVFVTGKGVSYSVGDADTDGIINFTLSLGSTTSTVVNASQFVGTARSGTDLELSEPPTELVGMANGSITKGKPVIVRTDGDFSEVKNTTASGSFSKGTQTSLNGASNDRYGFLNYNILRDKFLFQVRDNSSSTLVGMAVTVSNNTVTVGTSSSSPLTSITSSNLGNTSYFDESTGYHAVFGKNSSNLEGVTAQITSSGTVTWGSKDTMHYTIFDQMCSNYVNDDNVGLIFYTRSGETKARSITTTAGTITDVSSVNIDSNSSLEGMSCAYSTKDNKTVLVRQDNGSSNYLSYSVVTSSGTGTTLSTSTPTIFISASDKISNQALGYDITNDKFLLVYRQNANNKLTLMVGTLSGTAVTWGSATTLSGDPVTTAFDQALSYNKYASKFIVNYVDDSNSMYTTAFEVTLDSSGTITVDNKTVLYSYWGYDNSSASSTISAQNLISTYNGSNYSKGIGVSSSYSIAETNLTSTNFIGFAENTVADNEDVKVKVISQTDENQSSLTTASQYYVQNDGTLSTTAGTPSVLGGTALSSTKILIKS